MKGFALGVVLCTVLFGVLGWIGWTKLRDTRIAAMKAKATAEAAAAAAAKLLPREKKKRRRGAARVALAQAAAPEPTGGESRRGGGARAAVPPVAPPDPEPEPEPVRLGAADLKMVAQGDDLSRPDVVRMDLSDDSGTRDLGQDEIDARFRSKEEAVLSCISRARPDEDTYVPGRVLVKFRIQRAGTVRGVRVEAPAILQRGGIFPCIKGVLGGLRFPPSGGSQVVTYPFTLS